MAQAAGNTPANPILNQYRSEWLPPKQGQAGQSTMDHNITVVVKLLKDSRLTDHDVKNFLAEKKVSLNGTMMTSALKSIGGMEKVGRDFFGPLQQQHQAIANQHFQQQVPHQGAQAPIANQARQQTPPIVNEYLTNWNSNLDGKFRLPLFMKALQDPNLSTANLRSFMNLAKISDNGGMMTMSLEKLGKKQITDVRPDFHAVQPQQQPQTLRRDKRLPSPPRDNRVGGDRFAAQNERPQNRPQISAQLQGGLDKWNAASGDFKMRSGILAGVMLDIKNGKLHPNELKSFMSHTGVTQGGKMWTDALERLNINDIKDIMPKVEIYKGPTQQAPTRPSQGPGNISPSSDYDAKIERSKEELWKHIETNEKDNVSVLKTLETLNGQYSINGMSPRDLYSKMVPQLLKQLQDIKEPSGLYIENVNYGAADPKGVFKYVELLALKQALNLQLLTDPVNAKANFLIHNAPFHLPEDAFPIATYHNGYFRDEAERKLTEQHHFVSSTKTISGKI